MKTLSFTFAILALIQLVAANSKVPLNDWKFTTEDRAEYSLPDFDDSSWKKIKPGFIWEQQGFERFDGYAWYRIRFELPANMIKETIYKDSVVIYLGKIDDTEVTYLNGEVLGINGELMDKIDSKGFERDPLAYNIERKYVIQSTDKRLKWGSTNTIAIRVHDHGGGGGMTSPAPFISNKGLSDYIQINTTSSPTRFMNDKYNKKLFIKNTGFENMSGTLNVLVEANAHQNPIVSEIKKISLKPGEKDSISFEFSNIPNTYISGSYTFIESNGMDSINETQDFPYILTPKPLETPRINGAKVFGCRPGSPFLYRIPATGKRPMEFSIVGLPDGLQLNTQTGIIAGVINQPGIFLTKVSATNEAGKYERDFKIVCGDQLALTPPMGWNSWNVWGLSVDNERVMASADVFIKSGLADAGYNYINIDDGWEAPKRAENGEIMTNEKFPDMKATSDYVHSLGLKFGIYSSPGTLTCGKYLGSYQHELQDAETYAKWGVDYLKYDWCSYSEICKDHTDLNELKKPYILMSECLKKQPRDIIHSLCQYGMGNVWEWGGSVGGQLWRTTGDIEDTWESMSGIGFRQEPALKYTKPGNWNDPDMLVVGWVGWGPKLHPSRLTASEQYTHISLWALQSAPFLIGCDLTQLDDFTLNLLTNPEVIDVNQDAAANPANIIVKTESFQIWAKTLEDGSIAVGLFNLEQKDQSIMVDFKMLGLKEKVKVRNLWTQKDFGTFDSKFESNVKPHGVTLIKLSK